MPRGTGRTGRGTGGRGTGGMYSKILLILSGNAVTSLLTLVRNLLVARLIPVEDYGVAATFAVVMAFVEMISAFGLQQMVVQSRTDDPDWQAALQGFQVLRAVVPAAILFFAATPIATFLNVPEVAWAYQVLALAPLMNGLVHLDIFRLNRKMVYLPGVTATAGAAFFALLAVGPLYLAFGDYRVMLFSLILQFTLMAGISIVVSERAYRLRLDRAVIAEAVRFGWPLLINGMLLFVVLNGEKLVVGRELGMAALAIFAMGFTLTLTPTLVVAKSIQSFLLPQLSAVQDDDARFQPLARTTIEASLFNGVFLVVAVVLVGEPFVQLVLGEKYAALVPLMVWLAVLHGIRIFKIGGAVVALARGRTSNAMVANSFRVLSLPLSWWVAVETGDLLVVIWIATAGEALGVFASLILTQWRAGVRLKPLRPVFASVTLLLLAAVLFAAHGDLPALEAAVPRWSIAVLCVGLLALCGRTMRDSRAYLKSRRMENFEP
jgi:O-antigen/teichoic acid export membrane protein